MKDMKSCSDNRSKHNDIAKVSYSAASVVVVVVVVV